MFAFGDRAEAHAVVLQSRARQQMETACEVTVVFEGCARATPQRSVAAPSGTEQIELLSGVLTLFDDGDVFRKQHLD